jgi:cell division protein ZapA
MARVSITINGYSYEITCADGEEQHILDLAQTLDGRVGELVAAIGQAGEARLLSMAGLLLADELAEVKDEVERLRAEAQVAPAQASALASAQASAQADQEQDRVASVLDSLAGRIETIAERLEQA